jgi:hypothetical protein
VSTGKGAPSIVEDAAIGLCADRGTDKGAVEGCGRETGKDVLRKVGEVRLASSEQIGPWFADEVFETAVMAGSVLVQEISSLRIQC